MKTTTKQGALKWVSMLVVAGLVACGGTPPSMTPPDGKAPALVGTSPAAGATGVAVRLDLAATFSAAVTAESLDLKLVPDAVVSAPSLSADGLQAIWPALELEPNTSYTVTLAAADAQGRAVTGQTSFTFRTAEVIDTTAPTLESSLPSSNTSDVAPTTGLALNFSEPMNEGSVLVTVQPAVELGEPTWSMDHKLLTFPSMAAFEWASAYAVNVSGADVAGNALVDTQIVFTTAVRPDVTPPTVDSSAPSASAMDVPMATAISLSFSEPMNVASVDAAFSITPPVAGSVLWDAQRQLRSFQPAAPLSPSTQYTVTLSTGAKDDAMNGLAAPYSFSFTTAAAPDTTAPTLVQSTPAAGAKGVLRNAAIVLTFSEPMDKAATQAAFSITSPASANVGTFSWTSDGKRMTFRPSANFDYAIPVAWRLTTLARDLAGNALPQQVSRGFLVVKQGFLVLESVASLDGEVDATGHVIAMNGFMGFGDSAQSVGNRAFLSFDLSPLPADTVNVTGSVIYFYVTGYFGTPLSLGGAPRIEHAPYGAPLSAQAYGMSVQNTAGQYGVLTSSTATGWRSHNGLLASVQQDWRDRANNGARSQFRLRYPYEASANGVPDGLLIYPGEANGYNYCPRVNSHTSGSSCSPHMVVTYEYP